MPLSNESTCSRASFLNLSRIAIACGSRMPSPAPSTDFSELGKNVFSTVLDQAFGACFSVGGEMGLPTEATPASMLRFLVVGVEGVAGGTGYESRNSACDAVDIADASLSSRFGGKANAGIESDDGPSCAGIAIALFIVKRSGVPSWGSGGLIYLLISMLEMMFRVSGVKDRELKVTCR